VALLDKFLVSASLLRSVGCTICGRWLGDLGGRLLERLLRRVAADRDASTPSLRQRQRNAACDPLARARHPRVLALSLRSMFVSSFLQAIIFQIGCGRASARLGGRKQVGEGGVHWPPLSLLRCVRRAAPPAARPVGVSLEEDAPRDRDRLVAGRSPGAASRTLQLGSIPECWTLELKVAHGMGVAFRESPQHARELVPAARILCLYAWRHGASAYSRRPRRCLSANIFPGPRPAPSSPRLSPVGRRAQPQPAGHADRQRWRY